MVENNTQPAPEEQVERAKITIMEALQELRMADWLALMVLDSIRAEVLNGSRSFLLQQSMKLKVEVAKGSPEEGKKDEKPVHRKKGEAKE